MKKILNKLDRTRKIAIKVIAEDISLNEEDMLKRYNTLKRLSNYEIDQILESLQDVKKAKYILGILKRLNGHKQSSEIMEYLLCFEGKLLSAMSCLFYNDLFLQSKYCCSIISGLCFAKVTDKELLNIIIQLNNIYILLDKNKDNMALDVKGYQSFIAESLAQENKILQILLDIQESIYDQLENIKFEKINVKEKCN